MSLTVSPDRFDPVILDMDGVVTDTASLHMQAWRRVLDQTLAGRPPRPGEDHRPFTVDGYWHLVDGRPRSDGAVASPVARTATSRSWCSTAACGSSPERSRSYAPAGAPVCGQLLSRPAATAPQC